MWLAGAMIKSLLREQPRSQERLGTRLLREVSAEASFLLLCCLNSIGGKGEGEGRMAIMIYRAFREFLGPVLV